jgi:hypothetical protein
VLRSTRIAIPTGKIRAQSGDIKGLVWNATRTSNEVGRFGGSLTIPNAKFKSVPLTEAAALNVRSSSVRSVRMPFPEIVPFPVVQNVALVGITPRSLFADATIYSLLI